MRILAIDPGTRCGWALWDGERVQSGVWDFSEHDSYGARFIAFTENADRAMRQLMYSGYINPGLCPLAYRVVLVFEDQHFRGKAATILGVGFQTHIMSLHERLRLDCGRPDYLTLRAVHTATLKKWATGSGKASKADMVNAANRWLEREVYGVGNEGEFLTEKAHDQADALLLLAYAREHAQKGEGDHED